MVYLHCVPIEQLGLCSMLRTKAVTIVVPRITFKELDKHKSSHPSARIRDRARKVLALLESKMRSGDCICPGVALEFVPHMPKVDMETHGLNPGWNDDLLIASVLESSQENTCDEVVLLTHDTGARLTCSHLGLTAVEPPARCQLPREVDEAEREALRLRRELQRLKEAIPQISVGFGEAIDQSAMFSLGPPKQIDEVAIADAISKIQEEVLPYRESAQDAGSTEPGEALVRDLNSFAKLHLSRIDEGETERYNTERLRYLEQYEQYLRDLVDAQNAATRTIRFTVVVSNVGSAPADDVDVNLHFPDGFVLSENGEGPSGPLEPTRPKAPRTKGDLFQSRISMPSFSVPALHLPDVSPPSAFRIRRTNSYEVSDHFDRIKHGFVAVLPEFALTFDSHPEARSFHCEYEVTVGNLPTAVTGQLHFVIERGDS